MAARGVSEGSKRFSILIQEQRKAKGFSLRKLGEVSDVEFTTISRWEKFSEPLGMDMPMRVMAALDIPFGALACLIDDDLWEDRARFLEFLKSKGEM